MGEESERNCRKVCPPVHQIKAGKHFTEAGRRALSTRTVILNIDVITILIAVSIILGLLGGSMVYIASLFGAVLFPLIILCLSMPFERVRAFGEGLLSMIVGILLAPAISASVLAVVPFALQSSSGFLLTRAILLAGIILAIVVPLFVIAALLFRPIMRVTGFVKLIKGVVK